MYRKHLKEMESSSSSKNSSSNINKTGMKTIDAISEIPVVNSALSNVTEYYGKMKKESNLLFRTSLNLAELSVSVMSLAATPITTLCKKPIDSVDSYLCNKLHDLEHSYPTITKPTDQLTATAYSQAKQIYDQTLKQPIDKITNIKDLTTNKVNEVIKIGTDSIDSIKTYGCDQLNRSAVLGVRVMDACLETSLAKMFTNPVLNFTENALDYLIPESNTATSGAVKCTSQQQQGTTLKRLFDINSRVCRHLYQTTFEQLNKIHVQFETTIKKLQSLKQLSDAFYSGSRDRFVNTMQNVKQSTLVSRCLSVVNRENLSIQKMETFMKNSYRAILDDVVQMIEKYMSLVKNFPITFNGTKIRQTVESLISQLNKESFSTILTYSIDQLKSINESLISYTNQMFQVVNNSRIANLLKSTPGKAKSKALPSNSRSTPAITNPPATLSSGTKSNHHHHDEEDTNVNNLNPTTNENKNILSSSSNRTTPFTSPVSESTTTSTDSLTTATKSSSTTTAATTTTTTTTTATSHMVPPPTPALKSSSSDSNNRASSSAAINARELGENLRIVAARNNHNDDDDDDEEEEEEENKPSNNSSSFTSSGRDFEDDDTGDSSNEIASNNDDDDNNEEQLATRLPEPKFDDQSID